MILLDPSLWNQRWTCSFPADHLWRSIAYFGKCLCLSPAHSGVFLVLLSCDRPKAFWLSLRYTPQALEYAAPPCMSAWPTQTHSSAPRSDSSCSHWSFDHHLCMGSLYLATHILLHLTLHFQLFAQILSILTEVQFSFYLYLYNIYLGYTGE